MVCVRGRNCTNALQGGTVTYRGGVYGLCAAHERDYTSMVAGAGYAVDINEDARKLFIVTSSRTLFDSCMLRLVKETARRNGNIMTRKWRQNNEAFHLSKELTYYEHKCWFGSQKKIFAGLLSAQEFLNAMNNGYMVKDPGPGPNHGEFSHRLQWHTLMRVMTNDFTEAKTADWKYSPLRLFCWTGSSGYWGKALEGANQAQAGPGDPSWVDKRLSNNDDLKVTSLGRATTKRRNKRIEFLNLIANHLESYARRRGNGQYQGLHDGSIPVSANFPLLTGMAVATRKTNNPNSIIVDLLRVSEILYAFKKTGSPVRPTSENDHEAHIAWYVWQTEEKAKSANRQDYKFEQLNPGIFSTGSLLNHNAECKDSPIETRLNNSMGGLR